MTERKSDAEILFAPEEPNAITSVGVDPLLSELLPELAAEIGLSVAEQQQERKTHRGIYGHLSGGAEQTAMAITKASIQDRLALARDNDPEAWEFERNTETKRSNFEVRESMAQEHGPKEAEKLLARAEKFCRANPALHKILAEHGIGSKLEIVRGLVEHVQRIGFY